MYSTLVPHKPGRAAVPSIWGAQTEFDHWLRENDYSKVTDADGTVWDVSVQIRETPDLAGERMINKLRVVLKARLAVDDLVKSGCLSAEADQRFIGLLRGKEIPLGLKSDEMSSESVKDIKSTLFERLNQIRSNMSKSHLHEFKRTCAQKFLDQEMAFK